MRADQVGLAWLGPHEGIRGRSTDSTRLGPVGAVVESPDEPARWEPNVPDPNWRR